MFYNQLTFIKHQYLLKKNKNTERSERFYKLSDLTDAIRKNGHKYALTII